MITMGTLNVEITCVKYSNRYLVRYGVGSQYQERIGDISTQYICMYGHTYSKSMDQPGKIANPARGQLNRENECFPVPVRG